MIPSLLPFLPVLVPVFAALLALVLRGRAAGANLAAGAVLTLAVGLWLVRETDLHGVLVAQAGGWRVPLGITFAVDRLGAVLVAVAALVTLAGIAVDLASGARRESRDPVFNAAMLLLLAGVNGAFTTGDLFNLYVWFEVLLVSSFVLLTRRGAPGETAGGIPYVAVNLVGSTAFLLGIGMLYARTGTLNLAQLAEVLATLPHEAKLPPAAMLLVAFGVKAGVVPLFLWLPPAYPRPSPVVSAVFSGLLTKVGVYALLRAATLLFPSLSASLRDELLAGAALTMLVGVLAAASMPRIREILSFHVVSQIGYLVWGVALASAGALAGTVFYLVHHIVVKANLFLVGGLVARTCGSEDLGRTGGLWRRDPLLAATFLVPALSLAGLPPLSGFWAKFALVQAGLGAGAYLSVAVSLLVGFFTLYSMTKIWQEAFWKEVPAGDGTSPGTTIANDEGSRLGMTVPCIVLAIVTVAIGLFGGPLHAFAERAAADLVDTAAYREAVLGALRKGGTP